MRWWRRFRTLLGQRRFDDDVRRELEFHLAMEAEHRARLGMDAATARRTSMRDFGGVCRIREEVRDARGLSAWDHLQQDVRFGMRALARSRGYAFVAMLILGLGIGANTAMFSVLQGVLLAPLPFENGHELVLVHQSAATSGVADAGVSIPELDDYRAGLRSIRDLVEYHSMSFVLLNQGDPDRVDSGVVSANFFQTVGIAPVLGRVFEAADEATGAPGVLILGHEYWLDKFEGDSSVVGRVLEMNNRPHTVVGVLPPFPQSPRNNDVYMPTSACPLRARALSEMADGQRTFASLRVVGRLASGADLEQASREVAAMSSEFEARFPEDYARTQSRGMAGSVTKLGDQLVTSARPVLLVLAGATALVLLIACANVANLTFARTLARQRELAVRSALGASRRRLARQLLTESLMIALAGGVVGLVVAYGSLGLLVEVIERYTPRTGEIGIDAAVLWFTFAIALVTGLLFGTAPALRAQRGLAATVRDSTMPIGERAPRQRLSSGLVVAQVAVSFVLLVATGLLIHSLYRMSSVPLGYHGERVMTAEIYGNFTRFPTAERAHEFQAEVLRRLEAAPGIASAAVTNAVPLSDIRPWTRPIAIEGRPRNELRLEADANVASAGYFETLGIPLQAGRTFLPSDTSDAAPVAVINASMAALWNGANPIGSRFAVEDDAPNTWLTVVGIVGDFRLYSLDRDIQAQYYVPSEQTPWLSPRVLVRAEGNPEELGPVIKSAIHSVDPTIPVERAETLEQLRHGQLVTPGLTTALLALFAAVALVITLAGIAGLAATSVRLRTHEFGVRLALGSSRRAVLGLVLRDGCLLAAAGVVIGAVAAYAGAQVIRRFLFMTEPTDPLAYAAVAVLFLAAAAGAAIGPARRATTIDPLRALKAE